MTGSGDYTGQAVVPQPFSVAKLIAKAGRAGAQTMLDACVPGKWDDIPGELASTAVDELLTELIKLGQGDLTVRDLAFAMRIVHRDGSWT